MVFKNILSVNQDIFNPAENTLRGGYYILVLFVPVLQNLVTHFARNSKNSLCPS